MPRAGAAAVLLLAPLLAQPVRQERRTLARHAELVHELWLAARGAAPETVAAMDEALLRDPAGNAFAPLAAALAALRGVPCDDGLRLRTALQVLALPEVVDPEVVEDGDAKLPFRLHVTLHSPVPLAGSGPYRFAVALHDPAGKPVRQGTIGPVSADDLVRFAATVALPVHELPDGPYRVAVAMAVARAGGHDATEAVGGATVLVRRGFAARARALDGEVEALLGERRAAGEQAALHGALWPVQRVYTGEASDGSADLAADLAHAERVVAAARAGRPLVAGAPGYFTLALPLARGAKAHQPAAVLRARLRLPAGGEDGNGRPASAPLVVFVPGAPSFDGLWWRPAAPAPMRAGWLARALAAARFDARGDFAVLVLESAGEVEHTPAVLARMILAVADLAPIDRERVVLVGERDGAASVLSCVRAWCLPSPPRGAVCVAGGGLAPNEAGLLAHTELLLVPARNHPSTANLRTVLGFSARYPDRVHAVVESRAWSWVLPWALDEIEAFCRACLD